MHADACLDGSRTCTHHRADGMQALSAYCRPEAIEQLKDSANCCALQAKLADIYRLRCSIGDISNTHQSSCVVAHTTAWPSALSFAEGAVWSETLTQSALHALHSGRSLLHTTHET